MLERFSVYYCVAVLILIGFIFGYFFAGESIVNILSVLANITTIFAFLLAVNAYSYWRKQSTLQVQTDLIRNAIMDIAEIDCVLSELFSYTVISEGNNQEVRFPDMKNRIVIPMIDKKFRDIEIVMRKYYAIELNPTPTCKNMGKDSITICHFDGDIFKDVKIVVALLNQIVCRINDECYLEFIDGKLCSSKEQENISWLFDGKSFTEIKVFLGEKLRVAEESLRILIK